MIRSNKTCQQGLSLIELMIGITLSLLLILGVTQVFISSKTTYISNQALSDIQERGRFAVEMLAKDIRNAGYQGVCLTYPVIHIDEDVSLWPVHNAPIRGWENEKPPFVSKNIVSDTDSLLIQYAARGADVSGVFGNDGGVETITLGGNPVPPGSKGEVAFIWDSLGCDLFVNESNSDNALVKDSEKAWSHAYTNDFEISVMESLAYYVAMDNGVPTLFRSRLAHDLSAEVAAEALVPGISSIQLEFGVLNDAAIPSVSNYITADTVPETDWGEVAAVKVKLEVQAASDIRQKFSTTVMLRNRLL